MTDVREQTLTGVLHPEWVHGRRLWVDSAMSDVIRRLHDGDPTKGWEGDPRLAIYHNPPRWELWRLEADNEYRFVCRSGEDVPFDDRVIDALVAWDVRRRQKTIHDEIVEHNEQITAGRVARAQEYIDEEVTPMLRWALLKENR